MSAAARPFLLKPSKIKLFANIVVVALCCATDEAATSFPATNRVLIESDPPPNAKESPVMAALDSAHVRRLP